ncbi:MAG: hypothetical protein M3346_07635 [Actinomycetota bacterium]|nr:hypothetical protein [Actinomycetota bacterium]
MRGRVGLFIGFGAGYVLGAKAGTERYDQLMRLYENMLQSPKVKEATGKAKGTVGTGFEQAREKAKEGRVKVGSSRSQRRSSSNAGSDVDGTLSVAPPPTV